MLDHYGATSPAEFFAVATESFFGKPWQLAQRHPALYDELSKYYRVDPRLWLDEPPAAYSPDSAPEPVAAMPALPSNRCARASCASACARISRGTSAGTS